LKQKFEITAALALLMFTLVFATCRYSTKDISSIDPAIKTFRVNYLENKARYVNPQLSPKLTEALRQKISSQTRLREVNDETGDYEISGYISDYSVTTSGIANQRSGTNRLNVSFHLVFKNTQDATKNFEADVTTNYDFDANRTLQEAEQELGDKIIKNLTESIFNRIFSNW